jgi:hypothetical protein
MLDTARREITIVGSSASSTVIVMSSGNHSVCRIFRMGQREKKYGRQLPAEVSEWLLERLDYSLQCIHLVYLIGNLHYSGL